MCGYAAASIQGSIIDAMSHAVDNAAVMLYAAIYIPSAAASSNSSQHPWPLAYNVVLFLLMIGTL